jgi:hypothetical protein
MHLLIQSSRKQMVGGYRRNSQDQKLPRLRKQCTFLTLSILLCPETGSGFSPFSPANLQFWRNTNTLLPFQIIQSWHFCSIFLMTRQCVKQTTGVRSDLFYSVPTKFQYCILCRSHSVHQFQKLSTDTEVDCRNLLYCLKRYDS